MAYCRYCGKEIHEDAVVCPHCWTRLKDESPDIFQPASERKDPHAFGWGILGFCVPIAGLVLYLVWANERPDEARAAGIGALVSTILAILFYIVYIIIIINMLH